MDRLKQGAIYKHGINVANIEKILNESLEDLKLKGKISDEKYNLYKDIIKASIH